MARTFLLPKGAHIAPLPPLRTGDLDRKLPGGYCPRGMRTQWTNMAGQQRRGSAHDVHTSPKWFELERRFKAGELVRDSAI